MSGTVNKKYVPSLGIENRDKHSLFGQIVNKGKEQQVGPGSYDNHAIDNLANKKGFNSSL